MKLVISSIAAAVLLCACTPGGVLSATGGAALPAGTSIKTVDVNLTTLQVTQLPQGQAGGYTPVQVTVAVGSAIVFTNTDSFKHTATRIPGTTFPTRANSGLTAADTSPVPGSGSLAMLSQQWSTGDIQAGQTSIPVFVDRAGTYLFGCYYHYGSPMQGVIVAQ